jgi:leader peptidase (prepilin peptidase)/N-methyltransferase
VLALTVAAAAVLGLVVGSFLTVVVHRVPRRASIVRPRSACPACATPLRARDNVPVLSWLWLRGRCRSCRARVPWRYPLLELGCGALFAGAAVRFGATPVLGGYLVAFAALLALAAIDLEHGVLPRAITLPVTAASVVGLGALAATGDDLAALGGALLGAAVAGALIGGLHLAVPAGMGFGDVLLAPLLGLWLGWLGLGYVLLGLFLAFLTGALTGLALVAAGRLRRGQPLPFGPFLVLGTVVAVLAGAPLLDAYAALS